MKKRLKKTPGEITQHASFDKQKIKDRKIESPKGRTVRIDERTEIIVPADESPEDTELRIDRMRTKLNESRKMF